MSHRQVKPPLILFLYSDTGGGHRSATEAIIESLHLEFDGRIATVMVDFLTHAPRPFKQLPLFYPHMVRVPQAWEIGYHLSDGSRRARFLTASASSWVRPNVHALFAQYPADLIVATHPLATAPILRALNRHRPPFVTVVTDLVSTHALWYHPLSDLCLVATEMAFQRALACGLTPEKVHITGLPVAERFGQPSADRDTLRARFGWPQDRPVILLVGGGEGMGPLKETAMIIAEARLPAALAIVTGRNTALRSELQARQWPIPTFIYGFVREMPDLMHAADILVTKAGPSTISEAFIAGLPIVLYSRLPGQEDGNIVFVTSHGAGVWAPHPKQVVAALKNWVDHPEERLAAAAASRELARTGAARKIAHILAARLGVE